MVRGRDSKGSQCHERWSVAVHSREQSLERYDELLRRLVAKAELGCVRAHGTLEIGERLRRARLAMRAQHARQARGSIRARFDELGERRARRAGSTSVLLHGASTQGREVRVLERNALTAALESDVMMQTSVL